MPPEKTPTPPPEAPETPVQNVEAPGSAEKVFADAAAMLEYEPETPPETPPEVPDAPAEPKPAPKPAKKAAPAPEPTPEPDPEPEEPKKSKRELFMARAAEEKTKRDATAQLKEREAALQAREGKNAELELVLKQFQADPIGYLEKNNPRAYEEWTQRNLAGGEKPPAEDPKVSALEAKVEALTKALEGTSKETKEEVSRAQYVRYMADAQGELNAEEFAPVRSAADVMERLNGQKPDIQQAIAGVYSEYKTQYDQTLTPREVCEILLEDAQAYLDRVRPLLRDETPAEDPPQKKSQKRAGKTLTNSQETQSMPAQEPDLSKITNKEDLLTEAAKILEYEEPPE